MRKKIAIIIVVIALILVGVLFFKKNQNPTNLSQSGDVEGGITLSEKEMQDIIYMVTRHIKTPDEKPDFAVITDATSAAQRMPFLQGAKNGDILLIYPSISQAILFDPQEDVIINVGPVVFENPEGGPSSPTATDSAQ